MKPKIAVVCAFNPGNVGMHSVDKAALHVFGKLGVDFALINFQRKPWRPYYKFQLVRELCELGNFTHVLFWGDFQNNPVYGKRDFASREVKFGYAKNVEEGLASWRARHLDVASNLPASTSVASLGNCFLGAAAALDSPALVASFNNFLAQSAFVMPRDDWSLEELRGIAPDAAKEQIVPGLDLAFLQPCSPLEVRPAARGFGYFFGRSKVRDTKQSVAFLARALKLDPIEIPWLTGRNTFLCAYKHASALRRIKRCQFVLTDVYHLAVNAMNAGVPALCISRPNGETVSTVNDQKKYALMEQLHAEALHLTVPDDGSLWSLKERIIESCRSFDAAKMDEINEVLHQRRARCLHAISALLNA